MPPRWRRPTSCTASTPRARSARRPGAAQDRPLAILRAVIASFILGGCILLFAILSVSNINSPEIGVEGLQFVVLNVLGDTVGKIFLICVVIAITVCCLAVQTATIRMIFAMARDNNLPLGERLAKVHRRRRRRSSRP